ncbi:MULTISPECIES: hypothetical protein [Clostridium]|uniref:Exosortase n=1 Tax=Clostridium brassicae TaxID=2999072 RepID=A0ABT4D646_9CLOT|nr:MULTISPECIES: hypothetical protein [Clostridium]MCY6957765.1 hypothetical protein [Clostridium brassicae]WMJ81020.1 hypothetical protein RBU49_01840 [Clostridium sp. MB40-C1]
MNNIISIVLLVLLGVFFIIDYFKDKKFYMLLIIIPILIQIFFQTPLSNSISKTLSNILIGIVILVGIFIIYLVVKDEKSANL